MSLAQHAKSSVIWSAGFLFFREVMVKLATVVIFRRLLNTTDYGVFNCVNSVVGFLAMFGFNNFVAHTLQVREEADAHWQEHFTAGAFFQGTLFAVANFVALALRLLPHYAGLAPYLHALSVLFILDLPCEFRRKMLERDFNWTRLRSLHAVGIITGFLLALYLAMAGKGAYALLMPALMFTPPFIYDLFGPARWRPTWAWSRENYKPAWRFGWTRIASGLAFRGRQVIENVTIVAILGYGELGILGGALGLAQMATQLFGEQLLGAIYPVLTRVNPDPENVSRINALVLRLVAWVTIPVAVISSALAGPMLLVFYGAKWLATIPLLPWAMLAGVAITLAQTANTLLLSKEKLKSCLTADILVFIGTAAALTFALSKGLQTYLMAIAVVQTGVLALMLVWLVREKCLKPDGVLAALLPAATASVTALLAAETLVRLTHLKPHSFSAVVSYAITFSLTYLAMLRLAFTAPLRELIPYIPKSSWARRRLFLPEA